MQILKIILHHKGRLSFVVGDYLSGKVTDVGGIDSNFISITHLYKLLRDEFGYHNVEDCGANLTVRVLSVR